VGLAIHALNGDSYFPAVVSMDFPQAYHLRPTVTFTPSTPTKSKKLYRDRQHRDEFGN